MSPNTCQLSVSLYTPPVWGLQPPSPPLLRLSRPRVLSLPTHPPGEVRRAGDTPAPPEEGAAPPLHSPRLSFKTVAERRDSLRGDSRLPEACP